MKTIILIVFTMLGLTLNAQWEVHVTDNGFDPKYVVASNYNNGTYIKLEENEDKVVLYLKIEEVFLDTDETKILDTDIIYAVNGVWSKHAVTGVILLPSILMFEIDLSVSPMFKDFLNSSKMKIRFYYEGEEYIMEYNMKGSTNAYFRVLKQK
jgi:hypothetical protein